MSATGRPRLRRSGNRVIAGVAGGVADYFGISRTLVRWVFVLTGLFGAGEIAYIVLWILMPRQ